MLLSAIIITKNEEKNIERCIKSVAFANEVIVVDAESHDQTVAIAKRLGAKTFVRPWPGYGPQKNFGATQAQGEWLLFIDADEEVPSALAEEIKSVIGLQPTHYSLQPSYDFYWLKIVTIFLGRPLNHLFGHNLRLFKKTAGSWTDYRVHEQVQTHQRQLIQLKDKLSGLLEAPLLHHSHQTIAAYLTRMAKYTTLDAERMAKHDQHRSGRPVKAQWYLPWYLMARQFVKMYVYKRGILDGYAGFMWSALSAYYEYVMGEKYLRLKKKLPA